MLEVGMMGMSVSLECSRVRQKNCKLEVSQGHTANLRPAWAAYGHLISKVFLKNVTSRLSHTFYFSYNHLSWSTCQSKRSFKINIVFCWYTNVCDHNQVISGSFLIFSIWNKEIEANKCFFIFIFREKLGSPLDVAKGGNGFKSRLVFVIWART